jgi:replicative DNA helicase
VSEFPDLLSVSQAHAHFERYNNLPPAVVTPFPALNAACKGFGAGRGFAMGWYIVIGGDTGQGKSLIALQLAAEAAGVGHTPGFFSFEMAEYEIRNRFYAQALGIEARDLEPGPHFMEATKERVLEKLRVIRDKSGGQSFYVQDQIEPDIGRVLGRMDLHLKFGCDIFVVDYLQLLEDRRSVGMAQEIQRISASMRDFAHQNEVLVVGLSQYNNEGGNNHQSPPHVGHLYGGRRIAQDSDLTLLLDHSRYERDAMNRDIARTWMMLPKNRHGPSGMEIPIEWNYRHLVAREAMPDEITRWPGEGDR